MTVMSARSSKVHVRAHLLRVDIDTGEPASETWMRVVPPNHHLRSVFVSSEPSSTRHGSPSGLFQHVQHFRLENMIDRLDSDGRTTLRHGKDIHT